ncbi:hypothetical protein CAAN3_05S02806 [[Candida] anglica]
MHLWSIYGALVTIAVIWSKVNAQIITKDTVTNGPVSITDKIINVKRGYYWSIFNWESPDFLYPINVQGQFYIYFGLPNKTLRIRQVNGPFYNFGLVYFKASLASALFDLRPQSFNNLGDLYFISDRSPSVSFSIWCNPWTNYLGGSIYMYSDARQPNSVIFGNSPPQIVNDGQICLRNNRWKATSVIIGSGCIDIGVNSNFQYNLYKQPFNPKQTLYLSTPTSTLSLGGQGQTEKYLVAGFGGGNMISLTFPITKFAYGTNTGVLTLTATSYIINITIGKGYDKSLFEITQADLGPGVGLSPLNGVITYNGAVPVGSTSHGVCTICKDEPEYPPPPPAT